MLPDIAEDERELIRGSYSELDYLGGCVEEDAFSHLGDVSGTYLPIVERALTKTQRWIQIYDREESMVEFAQELEYLRTMLITN